MDGVVKKKKKSWFARFFGKTKDSPLSHEQEGMAFDVPLDDVRTDEEEAVAIAQRREELRAARFGNSDTVVTFDGND